MLSWYSILQCDRIASLQAFKIGSAGARAVRGTITFLKVSYHWCVGQLPPSLRAESIVGCWRGVNKYNSLCVLMLMYLTTWYITLVCNSKTEHVLLWIVVKVKIIAWGRMRLILNQRNPGSTIWFSYTYSFAWHGWKQMIYVLPARVSWAFIQLYYICS